MPPRLPLRWVPVPPLLLAAVLFSGTLLWLLTRLDPLFREAIRPLRSPDVVAVMHAVTTLGEGWLLGVMAVVVALVGYHRRRGDLVTTGWAGVIALILSGLIARVIKIGFGRPRPGLFDQGVIEWTPSFASAHHSFPSGHATAAFALAAVLAVAAPAWRAAFYALATLVAVSRVAVDAHFLSDVVAGGLVGWAVGHAVAVAARSRSNAPAHTDQARATHG